MSDQPTSSGNQDPIQPPPSSTPPQQPEPSPAGPAQPPPPSPPQHQQPASVPPVEPLPPPQEKVPFPLQQNEQVLTLVRRHWWFLWPWTLWLAIVALAPIAFAYWLLDVVGIADDLGWFFWIPALLWFGYWGVRALFNWYRYQNDIWVVTNQRLIDVFRSNPFNKRVTTADLVNIQDMRVERRGITATILGYADLICTTAGAETGRFEISGVPQAEELQLTIDRERDRERMRRE